MDHRNLLCKVCLSIGQCRGKLLDAKGSMAWSRAAIAADPTYSNGYSQLSIGLQHEENYEEAIENCKKALKGEGEKNPGIALRIERLEPVVNAKPNSKEWKAALWTVLEDKRGPAVRFFRSVTWPDRRSHVQCAFGLQRIVVRNVSRFSIALEIVRWYIIVSTNTIALPPKRRGAMVTRARK